MKTGMKYKTKPSHAPVVILDPSLEKEKDKIYFPEKLRKANEMLKTTKLPELKHPK